MRKTVLLTSAAALLASLALAQAYGPATDRGPAQRGPAERPAAVAERTPVGTPQARLQGSASLAGQLQGIAANALGLPADEVHALKQEGASFASIADDQGVDAATVEAAYLTARESLVADLVASGAISDLQAEQMISRGPDAFATLYQRDGCDEGQNVTGERLFANQAEMARGPQAGEPVAGGQPQGGGPRGRR